MTPRKTIEEKFSQFLFFEEIEIKKNPPTYRYIVRWITDPRLQRNLRSSEVQKYIYDEFALCRYFLTIHKNDSLPSEQRDIARKHIAAYLQEICYYSAQKIFDNIKYLPGNSNNEYDCFQLANKLSFELKFLKSYDIERMTTLKSFTSYAQKTITNRVEDQIRDSLKNGKDTDWALLRNITKTRFIKSLKKAGVNQIKQQEYLLVLQCYQDIYKPNDKKGGGPFAEPTEAQYKAMFSVYNQRLSNLKKDNLEIKSEPLKTWQKFQEMLRLCIDIARAYDKPPQTQSLSEFEEKFGSDDEFEISNYDGEILDVDEDEVNEREQVNQCLLTALDSFSLKHKKMLYLLYGFTFDQTETAVILFGNPKKQETVSKQKTKCFTDLLKSLAETLKFNLTHEILKQSKKSLEIWLINHYQQQIYSLLNQAFTSLNHTQQHIFRDYARIIREDSKQNLTEAEENMIVQFNSFKQSLIQPLKDYLSNGLNISISPEIQDIIETRLNLVIEEWLKSNDLAILLTK